MTSKASHRLPVRLAPFIGRQADLERLLTLLQDPTIRLVTILGPGGVGKSRLALELARLLQDRYQHGAVFVPLAQLNAIDELLPALAGALGVQLPPGGDLQQAVFEFLGSRQILLVLDNYEHLLDEATLVGDILVNGPQVKILVTSREKLRLEGETLYRLSGLELPPADRLENAEAYDSVHLFLQKASQARPDFSLNAANTPGVVRLCQLVDGNPLGILLAAAWLEHFSPAEIARETTHNLDFLAREVRDGDPRHAGMRAVFDSSFNRLEQPLQAVFQKLAAFRGGFDLAAAQAVARADLHSLIELVDKSLLARDLQTGRYDMHELLHQYAGERLAAASDRDDVLRAYQVYYVDFVQQRETQLTSPSQASALDAIQADFDNIRQAWGAVADKRDCASARAMLPGLYAFCDMRSRFYEGETLFRLASEALAPQTGEAPHPAWALALLSWYDMRAYIEPFESFEGISSQAQLCLEQAQLLHDAQGIAASLVLLGAIVEDQGDYKTAIQRYEEGLQSYFPLDDVYWVNMRIGLCYQVLHGYAEALQAFRTTLQRGRQLGERVKIGWSLLNIGDTLLLQGNPREAENCLKQAWTLFQEVGTTLGVLCSQYSLGRTAAALGQVARAREFAGTAAQLAGELHSPTWMGRTGELLWQVDPGHSAVSRETKSPANEPFSPRELEVLQLLKSELNGPDIARRLVVSLNTVRYHTKNIYQKLGVNTRLEAIRRAKELGL